MLCSEALPEQHSGIWHRDFYPQRCAPLDSYVNDAAENGPRGLQWNLALYDDDVLSVVPGSHLRRASAEEDTCLRSRGVGGGRGSFGDPLPHSLRVELGLVSALESGTRTGRVNSNAHRESDTQRELDAQRESKPQGRRLQAAPSRPPPPFSSPFPAIHPRSQALPIGPPRALDLHSSRI